MNVDQALKAMHKNRSNFKEKGNLGESAVLALLREYQDIRGGVILHSYTYPYTEYPNNTPVPGNVKWIDNKFEVFNRKGIEDEIDLVFVTNHRIFAIEVKARAGTWNIFDFWARKGSENVDKSPIAQAEKHCRHLYHTMWEYIPDGDANYIIPVVVFVDKATIKDGRCNQQKRYINLAILDTFMNKIRELDTPLKYGIDVDYFVENAMKRGTGSIYR